ncbi:MAG: hemerythrin domain-containing protein [Rhodospirillales bacterium]|nr:hemerythrin domain-containing protein [Rhodospirillales bacterium]MCW8861938.1 hemerythrin domain-containing protein [Rhodospirillales bacterium]MCW8952393.1 hemerythrin domain-containing protein [Rhodospirillales bacterium]MCW8969702.1 hemerythrin domain-containing protein [Rhodospirillales bacterium]MCW9002568.1 hemerythrin domain-containing protein [Rhodospirillales bacterium]
MPVVRWTSAFEIGIPDIDEDHKRILGSVQKIHDAIDGGRFDDCAELVAEFFVIARGHFEREERILEGAGYPHLKHHAARHKELLSMAEEVGEFCTGLKNRSGARECFERMVSFLISDIVEADLEFKSYLEDVGLVERPITVPK